MFILTVLFNIFGFLKTSARLALPLIAQGILLATITCGLLFIKVSPALKSRFFITSLVLAVGALLSLFFVWRVIRIAGQEDGIAAREKTAGEMIERVNAVRSLRHDFVNHVHIISAFYEEGMIDDLKKYVDSLQADIKKAL
ncbi:MAG: Spo0B domain-containing protein [Bacillota bacterium]